MRINIFDLFFIFQQKAAALAADSRKVTRRIRKIGDNKTDAQAVAKKSKFLKRYLSMRKMVFFYIRILFFIMIHFMKIYHFMPCSSRFF